jgi:hypothetical protein
LGERSLRHETNSRICVAAVSVRGLFPLCRYRGLGGGIPDDGWSLRLAAGWQCCHLMMIVVVPAGVWLRWPGLGSAGLWRVLRLPLRLNLALMELFKPGVLLK